MQRRQLLILLGAPAVPWVQACFPGSAIVSVQALQAEVLFTCARGYPLRSERL